MKTIARDEAFKLLKKYNKGAEGFLLFLLLQSLAGYWKFYSFFPLLLSL